MTSPLKRVRPRKPAIFPPLFSADNLAWTFCDLFFFRTFRNATYGGELFLFSPCPAGMQFLDVVQLTRLDLFLPSFCGVRSRNRGVPSSLTTGFFTNNLPPGFFFPFRLSRKHSELQLPSSFLTMLFREKRPPYFSPLFQKSRAKVYPPIFLFFSSQGSNTFFQSPNSEIPPPLPDNGESLSFLFTAKFINLRTPLSPFARR